MAELRGTAPQGGSRDAEIRGANSHNAGARAAGPLSTNSQSTGPEISTADFRETKSQPSGVAAPAATPVSTVGAMQAGVAITGGSDTAQHDEASQATPATVAAAAPPADIASPAASPDIAAAMVMDGVSPAEHAALLAALEKQRFLWSIVQQAARWELEGGEMRIYFSADRRMVSEMLQAREPMEKLRNLLAQVLARGVRVCVKLEASQGDAMRGHELRRKFERDPKVRDMLSRFGGQISSVRRRSED